MIEFVTRISPALLRLQRPHKGIWRQKRSFLGENKGGPYGKYHTALMASPPLFCGKIAYLDVAMEQEVSNIPLSTMTLEQGGHIGVFESVSL